MCAEYIDRIYIKLSLRVLFSEPRTTCLVILPLPSEIDPTPLKTQSRCSGHLYIVVIESSFSLKYPLKRILIAFVFCGEFHYFSQIHVDKVELETRF